MNDFLKSFRESVSDAYNSPETTTGTGFLQNVYRRFKGRLIFSLIFFLVFGAVAVGIILMILFFVLKAL
jgi:hypothetical protein